MLPCSSSTLWGLASSCCCSGCLPWSSSSSLEASCCHYHCSSSWPATKNTKGFKKLRHYVSPTHHHQHHIGVHAVGGRGLAVLLIQLIRHIRLLLTPWNVIPSIIIIACGDTNHDEEDEGGDCENRLHLARIAMIWKVNKIVFTIVKL